jgi:predicted transcriptional regulator
MKETTPRSPNRRRVLMHIQAHPGSCLQEIADSIGLTRTALAHHLRALERDKLVSSVRQGRRVLLFPSSITRPAERSVLGLLRQASARAVLEALYVNPTESFRKVAVRLGMAPHTLRWHVQRLQEQGIIHVLQHGMGGKSHTLHFHPSVRESLRGLAPGGPRQGPLADPPAVDLVEAPAEPQAPPQEPSGDRVIALPLGPGA